MKNKKPMQTFSAIFFAILAALAVSSNRGYAETGDQPPLQLNGLDDIISEELDKAKSAPQQQKTIQPPPAEQYQRPDARRAQAASPAPQGSETGTAVLNFTEANLKDILRTISEITGESFILAPGITAKISIQTTKPVPKKEVFGIFQSLLEINGLSAVKSGPYYKIVQAQTAKQRPIELYNTKNAEEVPADDRMINVIVPLEYVSSRDILDLVKQLLSPAGSITAYGKANAVIITDTAANARKSIELIEALDTDAFKRMEIALIPAAHVDVKTLNKELTEILGALGFGKDSSQLAIVPIERLNSLIVFSSSPDLLASVKEWIERLDKASSSGESATHIYYVKNDKASTIKSLLEQVYGGKKPQALAVASAVTGAQAQPQSSAQAQAASIKFEGGVGNEEIKIFIYEPSNALIIQSSPRDYQNILATIEELDKPPKQVLIDALIVEVKLDENTRFGIQWSALTGSFNIQQNTGIVSTTLTDPAGRITAPIGVAAPSGLSVLATDASKFFLAIQALASNGRVDVLSNPHIVVKNYEKASINVGSDEPVATQSTQTAVTGTAGLIQTIEYRKTGVILTVSPQITEGGMVAMNIRQEVSDKSTDRTVGNAVYPSFTKREAETSVVAKDRETLVIGGLIQDRQDESTSGIPLLSRIPLLGSLFRFTSDTSSKTELLILLTPTVISNPSEAVTATMELKDKLKGLKELIQKKAEQ